MKKRINMGIPEKRTMEKHWHSFKGISPFYAAIFFGIATILLIVFLVPSSQASLINGTYYQILSPDHPPQENKTVFYYRNITPENNPKEYTVKPGDTIYLGGTYDLTYVSGVSKQFAWWKDWKIEGMDCTPDIVNTISYIETKGAVNSKMVYIDPSKYKIGNWWQWDGCYIDTTSSTGITKWLPYANDNNLAFRIIYPPVTPTPSPVPTVPTIIRIPTKTPIPIVTFTSVPIPTTPATRAYFGLPWWIWIIVGIIVLIIIGVVVI